MPNFILVLLLIQNVIHLSFSLLLNLPLGAKCEGNWICSRIQNCSSIYPLAVSRPNTCSFINSNEPVYCCPPQRQQFMDYKIYQQCLEMSNPYCDTLRRKRQIYDYPDTYGHETPHGGHPITGGYKANPRSHTHMALVGYGKELDDVIWSCAGSIISPNFILSAAHCSVDGYNEKASWVRVGDLDVATNEDDANPVFARISQRIIYPRYKQGLAYHDIALFKLERDLHFSAWVGPVCLYSYPQIYTPQATISGWGQTGFVNRRSSHLMVVDLPIVAGEECKYLLGRSKMLPYGVDTNTMICAGDRSGEKDACRGDSGGPLVIDWPTMCLKHQMGIISFGRMCGLRNTPGVYTRIYPYLSWIQSIVWPESDN